MKMLKESEQVQRMLQSQERVMDSAWETAKNMQSEALRKYEQKKAAAKVAAEADKNKK